MRLRISNPTTSLGFFLSIELQTSLSQRNYSAIRSLVSYFPYRIQRLAKPASIFKIEGDHKESEDHTLWDCSEDDWHWETMCFSLSCSYQEWMEAWKCYFRFDRHNSCKCNFHPLKLIASSSISDLKLYLQGTRHRTWWTAHPSLEIFHQKGLNPKYLSIP